MKLRNVAKGTRAIKNVKFRVANAPPLPPLAPGSPLPEDENTLTVGVRVMTGAEEAEVLERAQAAAKAAGVAEWLDEHPLCQLHRMAHTLAIACIDTDSEELAEPFFVDGAAEVLGSPEVGADNIAYLYELQQAWQDECSIRTSKLSFPDVISILMQEAVRPENAGECPLLRMRPSTRASFVRITADLLLTLQRDRLATTSESSTNISAGSTKSESPSDGKLGAAP